ncbi:MAG: FAD-dependent oxidoreductase [Candidatus Yanofskybacteria bacterium]|nr:FAD-dependent oxidoreductase [Candidatus Yanofskybacteria bacterium]
MYDLIIIGGSAAGASAGVYAARRGLKFLIIAKDLGGEVALSGEVENWLGIKHTTGIELSQMFREHIESYRPEIKEGYLVSSIVKGSDGMFTVTADDGALYQAKAVIVATGAHSRLLGVPGEEQYRLKGVSYCTVCDGPLFGGRRVVTIGGGNSALESALMLADIAAEVTVINKNPAFKGEASLIEKVTKHPKIEVIYQARTTEITGNGSLATGLKYTGADGAEHQIEMDGAFVHIGQVPNSQMVPAECAKDAFGYITIGLDGATTLPGLFAAGDVTNGAHKQIIIAAGHGAAAALSAVQYINRL